MKKIIYTIILAIIAVSIYSWYERDRERQEDAALAARLTAVNGRAQAEEEAKLTPEERQKRGQARIKEAKEREQARIKELKERTLRIARCSAVCKNIENYLVQSGKDVTIGAVANSNNDADYGQHIAVVGPGVDHLFMRQFAGAQDMRGILQKVGVVDVVFMAGHGLTDWVGKWNLASNTLE